MSCDSTSFSTVFQSYKENERMIMKGVCNRIPFTVEKIRLKQGSNSEPISANLSSAAISAKKWHINKW